MTVKHHIVCGLTALTLLAGCKERTSTEPTGSKDGHTTATVEQRPAIAAAPQLASQPAQRPEAAPPPPTTRASAAARTYTTVREIFAVVPQAVVPKAANGWTDLKIAAANRDLSSQVVDHPARLEMRVREVGVTAAPRRKRRGKGGKPNAQALAGLPRLAASESPAGNVLVSVWAYFSEGAIEQVAAINPNDTVAVTGTITRADLTRDGNGVKLNIDLSDCAATKLAPPPASAPATESAPQ